VNICTDDICPVASCCEHGNEHSLSVFWWIFLTICVTKSFLRRSGVTFHFTVPHTCSRQVKSSSALCLMGRCGFCFSEKCSD
jgi:hypothetical protein